MKVNELIKITGLHVLNIFLNFIELMFVLLLHHV